MRTPGMMLSGVLLLIAVSPLRAATIHVDSSKGDDRRVGTAAEPKATISAAMAGCDCQHKLKWRRRESNPRVHSRNSEVATRLWNMLQDVGVSWEWNDDANRQPLALGHEELAEVITAWPQALAGLRQAEGLAICQSRTVPAADRSEPGLRDAGSSQARYADTLRISSDSRTASGRPPGQVSG